MKALSVLGSLEDAQTINSLKATEFEIALLLNFGAESLQYHRLASSKSSQSAKSAD